MILFMAYPEVVRDLWSNLLFYQLARDPQCLLQVVRYPNVVVLIPNQDPLHEPQSATNSDQIPRYGLYHHVKQSKTSNTPERIWSSVSERVVPSVRNETVCFTIGRTQTDDPFQTIHEVKEMVHPQLKTQGFQFWVALPVATFSSELSVGTNDLFKTIDILFLYQQIPVSTNQLLIINFA